MKDGAIHFVITGGTIDSVYDGIKDTVVPTKKSIIPAYLKNIKLYPQFIFTQVCMKDSRQLTENDRKKILNVIEKSEHSRVIITHGTYTMPNTARFLKANLKRKDQTIILTGSMVPMRGTLADLPSDGPFNLGFCVAQVQSLPSGVYVCMNGKVFSPDEVVKDLYGGKFTSIYK